MRLRPRPSRRKWWRQSSVRGRRECGADPGCGARRGGGRRGGRSPGGGGGSRPARPHRARAGSRPVSSPAPLPAPPALPVTALTPGEAPVRRRRLASRSRELAGESPEAQRGVWGFEAGGRPDYPLSPRFQKLLGLGERPEYPAGGVSGALPGRRELRDAGGQGAGAGPGAPGAVGGGPSPPPSALLLRFLLQMLLLGVVGAAAGRVAGSGGDGLGFRGLLLFSSPSSQCGRG